MVNKLFWDPIYQYIELDSLIVKIIDTVEFQRLKYIAQLGFTHHVYPSCTHTRFSHLIGCSYLSTKFITTIRQNQPELKITDRDVLLIGIAALIHDLCHFTASHWFDHYVIPMLDVPEAFKIHENRAIWLFSYMVDKYEFPLSGVDINRIANMIHPDKKHKKHFLYQIVCNSISGLDTDKIDYILRDSYHLGFKHSFNYSRIFQQAYVINNEICFPQKDIFNIFELYELRYKLHSLVYQHPVTNVIECMYLDIFKELNKIYHFSSWVSEYDTCLRLTDNIFNVLEWSDDPRLNEAKRIMHNIKTRNLYKRVNIMEKDIESYHIVNTTINFGSGDKNPIDYIKFYNHKETNKIAFNVDISKILLTCPTIFEKNIISFIEKN